MSKSSVKKQPQKNNLNAILLVANGKVTAKNKTDFTSMLSKLKQDEQKNICFCLLLNYKNAISNIALTKILNLYDFKSPENIFNKIPEIDLENFINFLPIIYNFNTKYFQKIMLKFTKLIPENKIEFLVDKLKEQKLLFIFKEGYANLIKRKPSIMLDFILNFDQTNEIQHKIFNSILSRLESPLFSPEIISQISLLFLCQKLKFDSKEFSSFCFYISNKYPIFPFEIQNNFTSEIGTIALSLYNYIFDVIPECREICVKILTDKMKKMALKQNEAIVMIHTVEDEDLIDVVISSIIYKGPFSVLPHIAARCKEKPKYQDLFNILFPAFICLMKLTEKNSQILIDEMENLTQCLFMPFVLNKILNDKKKDIIISYSKYNNIAFVLTHILKICEAAKKSLLQPITVSFENNPGDSFTALYILANSSYISDIILFRRVVRAIVRTCIPSNFKELVENYNFPTRIKRFLQTKYVNVESTHKFLLKVYSHKSALALKDERVLRRLKNLKSHQMAGTTQSVPSTPIKDNDEANNTKIPQTERKTLLSPLPSNKSVTETPGKEESVNSPQDSPEKTEQNDQETKPPEVIPEKKKSWSIFGFLSGRFRTANSVCDEDQTTEQPETKEEKQESTNEISNQQPKESTKEVSKPTTKESTKEVSKTTTKESSKEVSKTTTKETTKEVTKKASTQSTSDISKKPPKPPPKPAASKPQIPLKQQTSTRRTSTIESVPIKINKNRTNSQATFSTPPLEAPSDDDSISQDQELDELPEEYSEYTSYSDSEPLEDLSDIWAR